MKGSVDIVDDILASHSVLLITCKFKTCTLQILHCIYGLYRFDILASHGVLFESRMPR